MLEGDVKSGTDVPFGRAVPSMIRAIECNAGGTGYPAAGRQRFPSDAMTHFNLGCYTCQLGDIDQAKTRVRKAIELDAKLNLLALDDADL